MAKGQLPKAYLRVDPNLDQTHPDPGAFIRLLCAASRQPKRGRFKSREVAESALGKKRVADYLARRDVIEHSSGLLEVDGWDLWQEGDVTVGERMRRLRAKHAPARIAVTRPFDDRNSPSEASGVKASNEQQHPPNPPALQGGKLTDAQQVNVAFDRIHVAIKAQGFTTTDKQRRSLRAHLRGGTPESTVLEAFLAEARVIAAQEAAAHDGRERLATADDWVEQHGGRHVVARSAHDWLASNTREGETRFQAISRWAEDLPAGVVMLISWELRAIESAAKAAS